MEELYVGPGAPRNEHRGQFVSYPLINFILTQHLFFISSHRAGLCPAATTAPAAEATVKEKPAAASHQEPEAGLDDDMDDCKSVCAESIEAAEKECAARKKTGTASYSKTLDLIEQKQAKFKKELQSPTHTAGTSTISESPKPTATVTPKRTAPVSAISLMQPKDPNKPASPEK